jgi:hypothetical protein
MSKTHLLPSIAFLVFLGSAACGNMSDGSTQAGTGGHGGTAASTHQ